jgi:copper chaperone CopZ
MRIIIFLTLLSTLIISGCSSSAQLSEYNGELRIAEISVDEMTCQSCALGVEYQLTNVDGVVSADVKYPEGIGYFIYDPTLVSTETVITASDVYPAHVVSDKIYVGDK